MAIDSNTKVSIRDARETLHVVLKHLTFRWLFCWDDGAKSSMGFDCACCISWEDFRQCQCDCHRRLEELEHSFAAALQLAAEISQRPNDTSEAPRDTSPR